MTKPHWYRGSKEGRVDAQYSDAARTKKANRPNPRYPPLPPVEAQKRPPVPYRPDPRSNRPKPVRPVPLGPGDYGNGIVIDNETGKPVKPPKNPFASPPVTRGGLPVSGRRWPRVRVPGLPWVDLVEAGLPLVFPNPDKTKPPILPSNYRWCNGPVGSPPGLNYISTPYFHSSGTCNLTLPLTGQAGATFPGVSLSLVRHNWRRDYRTTFFDRNVVLGTVERIGGAVAVQPQPFQPYIEVRGRTDPNRQRFDRPRPEYDPRPRVVPAPATGTVPAMAPTPDSPYAPDGAWQWDPAHVPGTESDFGSINRPGTGTVPATVTPGAPYIPPVTRAPPTIPGERQRKILTRSAKIGIALYKALDAVSETAEVVEAIFEALPDDVQKRWRHCNKKYQGSSFGQYGVGGAHCKLQAIYHNIHRLDVEQALKNILKNELQDRIIGGMQAGLPKNTGAAHAEAEKRLAKWLDDIFSEELGL